MISSSQRPYLKISRLQLAQKLGILFITVHFLKRDIQGVTGHFCFVVGKAYRNITHDIPDNGLNQAAISGHYISDVLYPYVRLGISHAAADIHTHHTGNHLIRNGHGRPDGTAFSRVNVRHDADFAVPKRFFVADQADLLLCFSVQRRRIAQRGIEFSLYFDHNGDPLSDGAGTCGFHRSGSGYQEAVPGCIRPIS